LRKNEEIGILTLPSFPPSLPPFFLQAFPNSSHTYQAWACLEKERGNWDLAFSLFRSGIEKRPWDGGAYQPYALALKERGEMTSAMEVFQKGLQEDPYHCPLYQVCVCVCVCVCFLLC
jgi:tetratricopeptide (TPR) repeat protein